MHTLSDLLGRIYFPLAFIARFPYAMMIVGVLTLVVDARGSVQTAGLNSALVGVGTAVCAPLIGAAADRLGQRPTIIVVGSLNAVAMLALAWVAYSDAPLPWVFALGFGVGATAPQLSPMSRARLVYAIHQRAEPRLHPRLFGRAFAIDSTLDEMSFVFGPVVVGLLAVTLNGWVPVATAAVLTVVFGTAFALHHTTPPALPRTASQGPVAPVVSLLAPRLLIVVAGTTGMGFLFGSTLTALTALLGETGHANAAGIWYGVMGCGSAALALSVAWFSPRFPKRARWVVFGALIVLGTAALRLAQSVTAAAGGAAVGGSTAAGAAGGSVAGMALIAVALLLTGIGIGPVLVTFYGFAADRTPEGWSSTVMTMLGSGLVLGQAFAVALTGVLAEHASAPAALLMPLAGGLFIFITGAVNFFLTPPGPEHSTHTLPVEVAVEE